CIMKKNLFKIQKTAQVKQRRKSKGKRKYWTEKEDKLILALVQKYGVNDWAAISKELNSLSEEDSTRNSKQCRERYFNHLSPKISKDQWTKEEEKVLFLKHMELGNKWAKIADFLPQRTLNSIK